MPDPTNPQKLEITGGGFSFKCPKCGNSNFLDIEIDTEVSALQDFPAETLICDFCDTELIRPRISARVYV